MQLKTAGKIYLVAFLGLALYVLLNRGLSLLNEPSDLAVVVGYICLITACLSAYEVVWFLIKPYLHKDKTNETSSSND